MELDNPSKRSDRKEVMILRKQDGDDKLVGREEKRPRDYEDDDLEQRSREGRHRREEKRSRNDYDDRELEPRDHKREDRRSTKRDFEPKSKDYDIREDRRPSRQDVDDFGSKLRETHGNKEERRSINAMQIGLKVVIETSHKIKMY